MIRVVLAGLLAAACGPSTTAAPAEPAPTKPPVAAPAEPAELASLVEAADALCACPDDACADTAVDVFNQAIGERDLSGWSAEHRRRFHEVRWRGEDCNVKILAGGEGEVYEHAREALRDRYAGSAPENLEAIYLAASGMHMDGKPLPASSAAPIPEPDSCCLRSDGECQPAMAPWKTEPWASLRFAVDGPQVYWYSFERDGTVVTAKAVGDIDCDGTYGTFELRGDVSTETPPKLRLSSHLE